MNKTRINVVIIEDDPESALYLRDMVERINKNFSVIKILSSVSESITWLLHHDMPHIILSGTRLHGRFSAEIFEKVPITIPVIFFSDDQQHFFQAYESGGVDYMLKPIRESRLVRSFEKLHMLKDFFMEFAADYLKEPLVLKYAGSLLVYSGQKIIPIRVDDICYIESSSPSTIISTAVQKYQIKRNLISLSTVLDPQYFYRVNRQYIIARKAVIKASQINGRKLNLIINVVHAPSITVSKEKVSGFLKWLKSGR